MKKLILSVLLALTVLAPAWAGSSQIGGTLSPDGKEEIHCDLPGLEHLKNTGGRDGSGLCVFTSVEIAGHWQNVAGLRGFQKKMQKEPGGGWPEKVDAMLAKYAPRTQYVQYNGSDPAILNLALKTGRMAAVTYGYSPRYGGRVAHMVNLVHFSDRWAAVLDNNFPGETNYEWMPPSEFLRRWQMNGGGWAIVLLAPPPPPIPVHSIQETLAMFPLAMLSATLVPFVWEGGFCGPVGPQGAVHHEWRTHDDDPGRLYLYADGKEIGGYDLAEDYYRPYNAAADTWGLRCQPPVKPPLGDTNSIRNFGIRRDLLPRLDQGEEQYCVNGRRVDASAAFQAFAKGGSLSDDSGKLRLTVIGAEAECNRVLKDLEDAPALAGFRDRVLVQSYRFGDWAVQPFKLNDLPGTDFYLCLQGPPSVTGKGEALHAQTDYRGPDALAVALQEALRKADPNYRPDRTPDLTKPPTAPDVPAMNHPRPLVIGGVLLAIGLAVLLSRRGSAE